jgi:hypothetical protein
MVSVHPTCAHARRPGVPPGNDNSSDSARSNLATLNKQAAGEINALKEAYRAAGCIHDLVVSARAARDDDFFTTPTDLRALITLVNAEFERRLQLVKATIASMQSP